MQIQIHKLKIIAKCKTENVFIPLASTMSASSSPSLSTSPLDDGITTVKHYIYIHTNLNPRTHDTTKKYHFTWHDNIKCQSHCIYTSTCPYRCCPEMCRYCSRGNSNTQRSKIDLYCNVNDYLSGMKTLCICLYRRTVETETMMNSIVYIYIYILE